MKLIYCAILLAFAACSPSGFKSISMGIEKSCFFSTYATVKTLDHQNRMQLWNDGVLPFIHLDQDTVFFIAKTKAENGQRFYRIWNGNGALNYHYLHPKLHSGGNLSFSPRNIELISSWDTIALRKEEAGRVQQFHESRVQAVRVIIKDGKRQVNCMQFTEY